MRWIMITKRTMAVIFNLQNSYFMDFVLTDRRTLSGKRPKSACSRPSSCRFSFSAAKKYLYPGQVRNILPFNPWVCSHHTFAVRNLILKCLTGSHMTIVSKSNYRFRLNVNMDIANSISFCFNFGKGYHFVLRLKQHFFDKARFFFKWTE